MGMNLRHKQILSILEENGAVSVRALTKALFVSEATVRRDLSELEKIGAVKRTHGGAEPVKDSKKQVPLFIRESLDSEEKNKICKQAAALVREGDTVFLDGSSTAQYLVKYLAPIKSILAVTYSIKTAELLCRNHIKTFCTGGAIMENSLVCTGGQAIEFARRINPDICFLSCKGMDLEGRFTDTSEEETAVRRAFLENSRTRVLLMTKSKLGKTYFHTLCRINEIDHVFCDQELPEEMKQKSSPSP